MALQAVLPSGYTARSSESSPFAHSPRKTSKDYGERLVNFRGSGSIEADADTVMLLNRPDRYESAVHEGIIEVIIAKLRNGPTCEVKPVYLKKYMRYEDFAPGTPFDG